MNGPSNELEVTPNQVIDGLTRNASSSRRLRTLPANGPENGRLTVSPARTVTGTLIVIVVSNRPSGSPGGFPEARDWILADASVIWMSAEPWFVTIMMPTIFPVGPDGWTTFWTDALIVSWLSSSTKVTVIRNRVGEAIAVSKRTTERMGSGARCFFLPHGARWKRVAMGSSPRNPNRGTAETNPMLETDPGTEVQPI